MNEDIIENVDSEEVEDISVDGDLDSPVEIDVITTDNLTQFDDMSEDESLIAESTEGLESIDEE